MNIGRVFAVGISFAAAMFATDRVAAQTIDACVHKSKRTIRIAPPTGCRNYESSLSWNETGPSGPQGQAGAMGLPGPTGPAGLPGAPAVVAFYQNTLLINKQELAPNKEINLCQVTLTPTGGLLQITAQANYATYSYNPAMMWINTNLRIASGIGIDNVNSGREVSRVQGASIFHTVVGYMRPTAGVPLTISVEATDYGSSAPVFTDAWTPCKISIIEFNS